MWNFAGYFPREDDGLSTFGWGAEDKVARLPFLKEVEGLFVVKIFEIGMVDIIAMAGEGQFLNTCLFVREVIFRLYFECIMRW